MDDYEKSQVRLLVSEEIDSLLKEVLSRGIPPEKTTNDILSDIKYMSEKRLEHAREDYHNNSVLRRKHIL